MYFDNNATTRIDPQVRDAMLPFLLTDFANPSSPYTIARKAALAIERAREQVATLLGASPEEIYFTSGGTEANNAALNHLIAGSSDNSLTLTRVEHASVKNFAMHREKRGTSLRWLEVDDQGALTESAAPPGPLAMMWANNETGVLFPVSDFSRRMRVHTDAVQAAGKIPLNLPASGVETAAISAHKIHGPKGVGALFIRKGTSFEPYLIGGDQERGVRAGTENVAGIVGFGKAAELATEGLIEMQTALRVKRGEFEERVIRKISGLLIAGSASPRIPNTSMLLVPGCETEALIAMLDMSGICVSSGSACASGSQETSHVLRAMGLATGSGIATIRVSFSRFTTDEEIAALLDGLWDAIRSLRG
jgi:cysteine desulfurase